VSAGIDREWIGMPCAVIAPQETKPPERDLIRVKKQRINQAYSHGDSFPSLFPARESKKNETVKRQPL
jgi:hypothetical protein